jgi:hypothetical protein
MTLLMTPEETLLHPQALQVKAGDQPEEVDDESLFKSYLVVDCESIKAKFSTVS